MPLSPSPSFETWNRKLHYYFSLYFLFFLWLFSFTGLLLNHPQWKFAVFWPNRKETRYEKGIEAPSSANDFDRARQLMRQLKLAGEIDWPGAQQIEINAWGVMHVLHTFSGTRSNDLGATRDWMLTTVWVVAMDALGAGLLLMVLTSYYMWYSLKLKRRMGLIVLTAGVLSCGFFAVGLSLL